MSLEKNMIEGGSKIPLMCKELKEAGWVTYQHHDNWFKMENKPTDGKVHVGLTLNQAYDKIKKNG